MSHDPLVPVAVPVTAVGEAENAAVVKPGAAGSKSDNLHGDVVRNASASALAQQRVQAVLFYGVLILIGWLLYSIMRPFLEPLAWAGILAICFYPVHNRIAARFSPALAAGFSTALLSILLIAPVVLVSIALVRQGSGAIDQVQDAFATGVPPAVQQGWDKVTEYLPLPPLETAIAEVRSHLKEASGAIASRAGSILGSVIHLLFAIGIVILSLFFAFRDGPIIGAAVRRLLPLQTAHTARLAREIHDLIHATVTAGVIVGATQGFLGGLLFLVLGVPSAFFWGVVMAFLSLIPLVGSWPIWVPAALWLWSTGNTVQALIMVILGTVLVSGVDNVLRPMLLGGRTSMSMLLILISLLGGVSAFGFIGLILGPVVMAVALSLHRAYSPSDHLHEKTAPDSTK